MLVLSYSLGIPLFLFNRKKYVLLGSHCRAFFSCVMRYCNIRNAVTLFFHEFELLLFLKCFDTKIAVKFTLLSVHDITKPWHDFKLTWCLNKAGAFFNPEFSQASIYAWSKTYVCVTEWQKFEASAKSILIWCKTAVAMFQSNFEVFSLQFYIMSV